jgi:hypothetical protein
LRLGRAGRARERQIVEREGNRARLRGTQPATHDDRDASGYSHSAHIRFPQTSIGVEVRPQIGLRNETERLTVNRVECAAIHGLVKNDRERLPCARSRCATKFEVAATLSPKAFAAWASGSGLQLHGGQNRWILRKTKLSQIFPFQVQGEGFAYVRGQLIERWRFRHDRHIQALRYILMFAAEDPDLNRSLHAVVASFTQLYHAIRPTTPARLPALADS